jgi:hypothetical protein
MQINHNSDCVTYVIEEQELLSGCALNYLQRAVIQNMRVEIMQQLVSLTPSTMSQEGKETYWQQEAYLRGQLDILTNLISKADAVSESLQNPPSE